MAEELELPKNWELQAVLDAFRRVQRMPPAETWGTSKELTLPVWAMPEDALDSYGPGKTQSKFRGPVGKDIRRSLGGYQLWDLQNALGPRGVPEQNVDQWGKNLPNPRYQTWEGTGDSDDLFMKLETLSQLFRILRGERI